MPPLYRIPQFFKKVRYVPSASIVLLVKITCACIICAMQSPVQRLIRFIRSVIPEDPSCLMFLCGCFFLFISFQLRWWPDGVSSYAVRHAGPSPVDTSGDPTIQARNRRFRFTGGARWCFTFAELRVSSLLCGRDAAQHALYSSSYGFLASSLLLRFASDSSTLYGSHFLLYSTMRRAPSSIIFHGRFQSCGSLARDFIPVWRDSFLSRSFFRV